ncbi:precorrin-6A reductase [Christensenella tenuis]|uniref:precorrin-2 dehydrogenase n=1 Tax=Christensenella tenuis TaxID=2763033 RepID=A0ABR7EJ29_9FIRM|nr:precorrin-6A reductase [Christensenella tenuis]MBC5649183.1 precorrin-6A reductase [Christensenella tenuis]
MKVLIFAGTTEGRELLEFCEKNGIDASACVATQYGKELMEGNEHIISGRKDEEEIISLLQTEDFRLVVDATHPYASAVTRNVRKACARTNVRYIRLLRDAETAEDAVYFRDIRQAAEYLSGTEGNILCAIGAKEVEQLCVLAEYQKRVIPRILPAGESIEKCRRLGFENVIAKKGPFSVEENEADLKRYRCSYLVTKESGSAGGFGEKAEAAKKTGVRLLVIERPAEKNGISKKEVETILTECKEAKGYFPLFADIRGKKAVVVGGGEVASRRVKTLCRFAFEIVVVSRSFSKEMTELAKRGRILAKQKEFEAEDIEGAFLVVAATSDRELNQKIGEAAKRQGIFASIADCAEECSFYFPAIAETENLTAGIVGSGKNHGEVKEAAQKVRECLYDYKSGQ